MQDIASVILGVGVIVFLAHLFSGIFNRIRVPDVIFLILVGICLGPVFGLLPVSAFGELGNIFATITLIIILFEYGITLKLANLHFALKGALGLSLLIFPLSMAAITGLVFWLTDLQFLPALIVGAIVGSTSEAIVIPIVKQLKIREDLRALLSVESTFTAVLSIVVALALIEAYQFGEIHILQLSGKLLASFIVSIALGAIGALGWSFLLQKLRSFKNTTFTTAAFVFVMFGLVEMLGFNGAITALVFGITLGNLKDIHLALLSKFNLTTPASLTEMEKIFFSEIAFLLKTFFFVYLGISLELITPRLIILGAIFTVILFVLRVISVRLTVGSSLDGKEQSIVSAMGPRGLTAIVLASIPLQQGLEGGELIKSLIFGIVLFSVVLTSISILLLDKIPRPFFAKVVFFTNHVRRVDNNGRNEK